MKRLPLAVVAFVALTLAVTGCGKSGKNPSADTLSADTIDSVEAVISDDTLAVKFMDYAGDRDSTATSCIRVDWPTGTDAFAQTVKEFIAEQLKTNYFPRINSVEDVSGKYPYYKGGLDKPQAMIDFYGKGVLRYLIGAYKELAHDMREYGSGDYEVPQMSYSLELRKYAETSRYVTYHINDYSFTGGAHGSYSGYSVNISKVTNRPVAHSVDSTRLKALQPMLRKGVVRYLRECGESDANTSNLSNYLLLPEESKGIIPLPAIAPYVEKDSLCFIYQQYEIAPYALGLVSFNIALKDIKPYLTKEARNLME